MKLESLKLERAKRSWKGPSEVGKNQAKFEKPSEVGKCVRYALIFSFLSQTGRPLASKWTIRMRYRSVKVDGQNNLKRVILSEFLKV